MSSDSSFLDELACALTTRMTLWSDGCFTM